MEVFIWRETQLRAILSNSLRIRWCLIYPAFPRILKAISFIHSSSTPLEENNLWFEEKTSPRLCRWRLANRTVNEAVWIPLSWAALFRLEKASFFLCGSLAIRKYYSRSSWATMSHTSPPFLLLHCNSILRCLRLKVSTLDWIPLFWFQDSVLELWIVRSLRTLTLGFNAL